MGREELFDSFYHATRRSLVLQTFVLTGDLAAAQSAVRDAYVAAWHHWRKAFAYNDPEDWVRPRAWTLAQRRHTARLWHRTKGITPEHKAVLDAVGKLPMSQRRILVLTYVGGVPIPEAARELGYQHAAAEQNLRTAVAAVATALGVDPDAVRTHLLSLSAAADMSSMPRASIVRRAGRKRRRWHTAAATAVAIVLAVSAGAVAYEPPDSTSAGENLADQEPAPAPEVLEGKGLPTAKQMLDERGIAKIDGDRRWRVVATHDNTTGNGLHSVCQQARFADPDGLSAVVREFRASGKPRQSAVQTMEISKSPKQAKRAYDTVVGWFASCDVEQVHLLRALRVTGVGDRATVLLVRSWGDPVRSYSVAVSQVGQVVTSTVSDTRGTELPRARNVVKTLAAATANVCKEIGAPDCDRRPKYEGVAPPSSGEEPGLLAEVDLPPMNGYRKPWVGTEAHGARKNPSATTCDRANFARSGAVKTRAKTFLIPGSRLPDRFGLSETYGTFGSPKAAAGFLDDVRGEVARCEDRDLATQVVGARSNTIDGMPVVMWDFETEISDNVSVLFRVGFVRKGKHVAQVTFAPADSADMDDAEFRRLLVRAGQRLGELS